MRKFLIPLLLASVALPAAAQARPDNDDAPRARSSEHRNGPSAFSARIALPSRNGPNALFALSGPSGRPAA